ncbi:phospholipid transport system substrate-binding protein [uncultured Gammaproteobacteria bacterium]
MNGRRLVVLWCLVIGLGLAGMPVGRAETPPQAAAAAAVVESLHQALIATMKDGHSLGFQGRAERLAPVVAAAFSMAQMTRIAAGTGWAALNEEQRQRLTASFQRFSVSNYARNFDSYDGEKFETTGVQLGQGDGVVVLTRLVLAKGDPVELNYLLRPYDGAWKIIDIYLSGTVSELASRRAEFNAVLQREGYDGLVALLDKKARG